MVQKIVNTGQVNLGFELGELTSRGNQRERVVNNGMTLQEGIMRVIGQVQTDEEFERSCCYTCSSWVSSLCSRVISCCQNRQEDIAIHRPDPES